MKLTGRSDMNTTARCQHELNKVRLQTAFAEVLTKKKWCLRTLNRPIFSFRFQHLPRESSGRPFQDQRDSYPNWSSVRVIVASLHRIVRSYLLVVSRLRWSSSAVITKSVSFPWSFPSYFATSNLRIFPSRSFGIMIVILPMLRLLPLQVDMLT